MAFHELFRMQAPAFAVLSLSDFLSFFRDSVTQKAPAGGPQGQDTVHGFDPVRFPSGAEGLFRLSLMQVMV